MEGKVLGHCRLVRLLGKGGMGEVWLARHETLHKDVAVKILPIDFARNAEAVERFLREARSAARLEHPNVVQVLDAGSADGVPFIVMQYVDGTDLEKHLKRKGRFETSDALSIAKRMLQALGAAHKLGIVHRDIKPSNVLLTKQGRVMVADFGLARDAGDATITTEGMVMGTPQYIAPEQARGEKVDARSDLYSLGCTLYHFLAGKPPYTGATPLSVALKHASDHDRPEPLPAPAEISVLVGKLMAKRADDRFQSAEEAVAAIDRLKGAGATVPATVVATSPDLATMVQVREDRVLTPGKRRALLMAGAGAGVLGLIFLVVLLAVLGPGKAEKSFRSATQAKTAEERLVRYRETAKAFPGTEWAQRAEEEVGRIFEAELKPLKEVDAHAAPAERVEKMDALRKRFPEKSAAVDRVEQELHRARVLDRCETLASGLMADRPAERIKVREVILPEVLKKVGEGGLRFWMGAMVGIVLGPNGRFEKIEYARDKLDLKRRVSATIPVHSVIVRGAERREYDMIVEWVWSEGDWYLGEKGIREEK